MTFNLCQRLFSALRMPAGFALSIHPNFHGNGDLRKVVAIELRSL